MLHNTQTPSNWLSRFAPWVPAGATLLDVACGHGRHATFFARRGAMVTAVDRDEAALDWLRAVANVTSDCLDLESGSWPYAPASFDAVLVCNYLWRPTFNELLATVKPGGLLLYETFMDGNEQFGKPSRPDFLLRSNELLARTRDQFEVIAFEQGPEFETAPFEADSTSANVAKDSRVTVAAVKQKIIARKLG
ncbi:MAG: class I SAM-dependent methyltransferase [Burkholderiales bacterium]|nr:MAG: class I SAM-dependent methyltransferase [Betaproteobacteria bacterium]TAG24918.1 MAG: class I SAM-dependent methyltransferase [Burkholderiales bacterium]